VSDISRLLEHVATAPSTEEAAREVLRSDYADLQQQAIAFLRREDVR
jgi:hypothetical protein